MGVWIETYTLCWCDRLQAVTPCMGVWIETFNILQIVCVNPVTPCMGVWIETDLVDSDDKRIDSHTLYGCVD